MMKDTIQVRYIIQDNSFQRRLFKISAYCQISIFNLMHATIEDLTTSNSRRPRYTAYTTMQALERSTDFESRRRR